MAGAINTSCHGLCMCSPLDFRHPNWQAMKVSNKMFVRRQLETLWELVDEYGLAIDMALVKSNLN